MFWMFILLLVHEKQAWVLLYFLVNTLAHNLIWLQMLVWCKQKTGKKKTPHKHYILDIITSEIFDSG